LKQNAQVKTVAGYGAAAKGNTLLNYAGVRPDLLPLCGRPQSCQATQILPASHIPIVDEQQLQQTQPDMW